jgi:hypothetical protein
MHEIVHNLIFRETLTLPSYSGKSLFCLLLGLKCTKSYADSYKKSYGNSYAGRCLIFLLYRESYPHPICCKSYADSYGKSYTCRRPLTLLQRAGAGLLLLCTLSLSLSLSLFLSLSLSSLLLSLSLSLSLSFSLSLHSRPPKSVSQCSVHPSIVRQSSITNENRRKRSAQ